MHPIYARLLRMLLQQASVDSDQVLAAAALDWNSLQTTDQRLPRNTVIRLVQAAIQATGKPWLGLELGDQAPVSAHGPLGYAAVTAPDLEHCLKVLGRYGPVREDSFSWSFQTRADGGTLQVIDRLDWGEARSFVLDTMAAALVRVLHAAVGALPAGLRLDIPLPQPSLGRALRTGAGPAAAVWPAHAGAACASGRLATAFAGRGRPRPQRGLPRMRPGAGRAGAKQHGAARGQSVGAHAGGQLRAARPHCSRTAACPSAP